MRDKTITAWIIYLSLLPLNITYFLGLPEVMPADFILPVLLLLSLGFIRNRLSVVLHEDYPVLVYLLIYLIVASVGAAGYGIDKSLFLAVTAQVILVGTYFLFRVTVNERRKFLKIVLAWVVVSTIVAIAGIAAVFLGYVGLKTPLALWYPNLGPGAWRLIGTTGQSSNFMYSYLHAGFFLSLGLLFSLKSGGSEIALARLSVNKIRFAVWVHLLAMILTFSRGLLGLILGLIVLVQVNPGRAIRRINLYRTALWAAFALLFIYSAVFFTYTTDALFTSSQAAADSLSLKLNAPQRKIYSYKNVPHLEEGTAYKRLTGGFTYLPSQHLYLLRVSWHFFTRHPWFGIGPGRYPDELEALRDSGAGLVPPHFLKLKPHSTFLGALAEGGLVGFAGLAILWIFFLGGRSRLVIHEDPLGTVIYAALAGYLLFGLNVDIMNFRWLWLVMALFAAGIAILKTSIPPDKKPPA